MSYASYRIDFRGLTDTVYEPSGFASGVHEIGITDPRGRLDAAATTDEIADILADSLRLIITFSGQYEPDESLRRFKRRVRDAGEIYELLDIKATCKRVIEDGGKVGAAYQLTYDFPSRTGTFSEARLSDGEVAFMGDPFVNDEGEEYNPFVKDVS